MFQTDIILYVMLKHLWTPLHYSAMYDFLDITELLIKRGANVNARDTVRQQEQEKTEC